MDPLDGPCGLAFDSAGHLWVNNFHRNVDNLDAAHDQLPLPSRRHRPPPPTGVAVDPTTEHVYVDNRTYITAYELDGTQVLDGLEPLRIGVGNLGDGYGLAVSAFPGTAGRIYVPDAATNTVKVYDPAVDKVNPGGDDQGPGQRLQLAAATPRSRSTGSPATSTSIDNLQPVYTEEPEAAVYVFSSAGAFLGVLKYKVYDALPPGHRGRQHLVGGAPRAASTSPRATPTRPGSTPTAPAPRRTASFRPASALSVTTGGSGGGVVTSSTGALADCSGTCSTQPLAGSSVTFTAIPDPGSDFSGWSGACSGPAPTCTVTMDEAASVERHLLLDRSRPAGRRTASGGRPPPRGSSPPAPSAAAGRPTPPPARHQAQSRRHRHRVVHRR